MQKRRIDPLEEVEELIGEELPGPMHKAGDFPHKLPKKIRGAKDESYFPMHGGRK